MIERIRILDIYFPRTYKKEPGRWQILVDNQFIGIGSNSKETIEKKIAELREKEAES